MDSIADNAVIDKSKFVTHEAMASINLPPHLRSDFESVGYMDESRGVGCGVIRVNVNPRSGGVGLSVALEDGDTEFSISVMPMLDREESLELARAIIETVEGMDDA